MKNQFLLSLTVEKVESVVSICKEIKSKFDVDVDVKHGRNNVDGCSVLGVYSLVNHIVTVCPLTDDDDVLKNIYDMFLPLDAFN